ncbi:N-myc-interactor isoform X1 [Pipra filicauda]|uniref:N-myc-interactor isoform X1 n=2 Tax=Pipra filicauda TaxID=649802 RepID=A0A6J2HRG1_9PASS|nr:N-myc-interactor isoform X1 [Pipra filicauda]
MDLTSPPLPLRDNGFEMVTPDPFGTEEENMQKLKEELKAWKERVVEAENLKADLLFSNACAEEECANAQEELMKLKGLQENDQKDSIIYRDTLEDQLHQLYRENAELKKDIEKLNKELEELSSVQAQSTQLQKKVAGMKLKFSHMEGMSNCADMDTRCVFDANVKIPFRLNQNQALLTFEDEEVAQRLIKKGKHTVNLDNNKVDVRVLPVPLDMGVKFELHVTVSGRKINVSNIPELPIPEDWMRDKLELNFYKTQKGGGGEIENVTYDNESRRAVITFLRPGASNSFWGSPKYPFSANGSCYTLFVSSHADLRLKNFQTYCGVSKKTILLKGIQEVEEDEESIQDMIEIHFQKPSNGGGEIENIKYVSKGAAYVCFEEDTGDAT